MALTAASQPDAGDFAAVLLRRRTACGLTQEELAERAAMTPRAISDLERGVVRRPRRASAHALGAALGLAGAELEAFVARARGHSADPPTGPESLEVVAAQPVRAAAPGRWSAGPGMPACRVPAQLPAVPTPFVGRAADRLVLDAWAAPDGPAAPMLVTGGGGVGKTALVVRWAADRADLFPDGCLFLDLRGDTSDPLQAVAALRAMVQALTPDDARRVPDDVDGLTGLFRTLTADRRLLVVLDAARDAGQVRPLLPSGPRTRCVVTTRDRLPGLVARCGAVRLEVPPLPQSDAVLLLKALLRPSPGAGPDVLADVAGICGRLPLTLRTAADRVATGGVDGPAGLLRALRDPVVCLDLLDADGDDSAAVRPLLADAFRRLDPLSRNAFPHLADVPRGAWDSRAFAAVAGLGTSSAATVLAELSRRYLVERHGPDAFEVPDVVRFVAQEQRSGVRR